MTAAEAELIQPHNTSPLLLNVSNCVAHFSKKLSNPVHNILGIRGIRLKFSKCQNTSQCIVHT